MAAVIATKQFKDEYMTRVVEHKLHYEPVTRQILSLIDATIDSATNRAYQELVGGCHDIDTKTIEIKVPRALGHSTVAFQLVVRYPNSIMIFCNGRERARYFSIYPEYFEETQTRTINLDATRTTNNDTFRANLIHRIQGIKLDCELVIIDNASMYTDEMKRYIIDFLASYAKFLIFLG